MVPNTSCKGLIIIVTGYVIMASISLSVCYLVKSLVVLKVVHSVVPLHVNIMKTIVLQYHL